MQRRTVLKALAIATGAAATPRGLTWAQNDATPAADTPIPPIRWYLVSIDARETTITPDDPSRYWIQFVDDGVVLINADCNGASGTHWIEEDSIEITDIVSTLVFCGEDSIDREFLDALKSAFEYSISSDGSDQLMLTIGGDGASAVFAASPVGVVWEWEQFVAGNDSMITPDAPERYTIEFLEDSSVQVVADCNTGTGEYIIDGNQIDMSVSFTEAACGDESSAGEFIRILEDATSFVIRDGHLHLALPMDAGIASFRIVPGSASDQLATPEA